jgi:hypothetical protein
MCTNVLQTIDATGTSASPAMPLPLRSVLFWRLRGRIGSVVGTMTGPVWPFRVGARTTAGADTSQARDLDANGDGFADVAISAPNASTVYVFLGSASGLATSPSTIVPAPPGTTSFGTAVAAAGDVNGDGFGDLAVGGSGGFDAYVYLGSATGLSATPSVTISRPPGTLGTFGSVIDGAQDTNGDGYADVVFGAPDANEAFVFAGSAIGLQATPLAVLPRPASGSAFGIAVAGCGDVDGDGFADVLVGTGVGTNRAYVFYGSASGPNPATTTTLSAPSGASNFGASLSGAGDANGDGLADLLIGAPSSNGAFVFLGASSRTIASPQASIAGILGTGFSVSAAGDMNGDGFDDVLIGNDRTPEADVFVGSATGVLTGSQITLTRSGVAQFGRAVRGAGDLDSDGYADAVIGAPGANAAFLYRGSATFSAASPGIAIPTPAGATGFGATIASIFGFSRLGSAVCERSSNSI